MMHLPQKLGGLLPEGEELCHHTQWKPELSTALVYDVIWSVFWVSASHCSSLESPLSPDYE